MKRPMRPIFAVFAKAALWLVNLLLSIWTDLAGLTDWSLVSWAFASSTAFMVYEAIPPNNTKIKRKGKHIVAIIALGMFVSLAFNGLLAKKWDIERSEAAALLGFSGYVLLGKVLKQVNNSESVSDLTDLNNKKP